MKRIEKKIAEEKANLNIHEYAFMKSSEVIFSDEVRKLCERNACGMYGKSWACPPGTGTVEQCKQKCNEFNHAFMFTSVTHLKHKHHVDEWLAAMKVHEGITEKVAQIFRAEYKDILTLSTEGCTLCKTCTYPDKPCRFPERMFPATEAFGILVMKQAQLCNIKYNNGPNTVTYFSMIFF